MKNKIILLITFACLSFGIQAQKYITKTGTIEIFSETPMFTIEGTNRKVASVLNTETGDVVASTLVRSFKFKEALVEEHFNENYIESNKFPKSIFKGKVMNIEKIDFSKDGSYDIIFEGKLTIHGATNYIKEKGKLSIKDGVVTVTVDFSISLKAYEIKVEKSYQDAIKDNILLKIHFDYKPYVKKK